MFKRIKPWGNRRGGFYHLALSSLRVIRREGFGSFWNKAAPKLKSLFSSNANDPGNIWRPSTQSNLKDLPKFYPKLSAKDAEKLVFPQPSPEPETSIIIPVYNKMVYTLNCLKSILKNTTGDYEVIVIDDCSSDDTGKVLPRINNLRLIKNDNNSGFLVSCNRGALASRGKNLLFLNSDTLVTKDWLSSLLKLSRQNEVGAVGSRLIYPDGTLQEAGGIIWNDGTAKNYGRDDSPEKPEYNYVREVDFCSGACLLVKRNIFIQLGGFDNRFTPAYFEDSDLCFSIRKLGYKVLYQPSSVIIHFERISYGDSSAGINKHQQSNLPKFVEKWSDALKYQAYPNNDIFLARDRVKGKKIILIIDEKLPEYDQHAGGLTMFQYTRLFVDQGYKVIFVPDDLRKLEPYASEMQQMGIEVMYGKFNIDLWLEINGKYLDAVWLSKPDTAIKYIDKIKTRTKSKTLYYVHDLHYLREQRRYEIEKNPRALKESKRLKIIEFRLFNGADVILTPSKTEKDILSDVLPGKKIEVIPAYMYDSIPDQDSLASYESRKDCIFVGGFNHSPNVDGAIWFVKEIFPIIKKRIPDIRLFIAGSNPNQAVLNLASADVVVTGYVKDLEQLLMKTRVFVSPLRYGAGIKGKIVTSMSCGLPVVTTEIGNEGMGMVDEQEALIADKPEDFADKVVKLYTSRTLWEKISRNSLIYVQNNFSTKSAVEKIAKLIQ